MFLVVGVEFFYLGKVKLEPDHLDLVWMGCCDAGGTPPSNWDVPHSPKQYIEEIGIAKLVRQPLLTWLQ